MCHTEEFVCAKIYMMGVFYVHAASHRCDVTNGANPHYRTQTGPTDQYIR